MIITSELREYFQRLQARVSHGMAKFASHTPYIVFEDPVVTNYELLRETWFQGVPIQNVCRKHNLSRSQYDEKEGRFVEFGVVGLFPEIKALVDEPDLERLVIMVSKAQPSLSSSAILRIAETVPTTQAVADLKTIEQILASYGRSGFSWPADIEFWSRIQRTIGQLDRLKQAPLKGRDLKNRRQTFFIDSDLCHKRLELLREVFFHPNGSIKLVCLRHSISPTSYYRLVKEYRLFGPWAVIPANMPGKESMSDETELSIIMYKLRNPLKSAQQTVKALKLHCSRFSVHRIFSRWGLTDRTRPPAALDQFFKAPADDAHPSSSEASAFHLHSETALLESRRIDLQFEQLCHQMRMQTFHLCDPGPLLLAPFVHDLGIIQAMESYGPAWPSRRGFGHPVLLNVFRILGGYRNINQLRPNRDQSVVLASGLAMFGTRLRDYYDIREFRFKRIQSLRIDLIKRAKELGLFQGREIAFDFRFKALFDANGKKLGMVKGANKQDNRVHKVLPHVCWDLTGNTIMSINNCYGLRSPRILEHYCEKHIFTLFDPQFIEEIHMGAEFAKENSLQYIKQVLCPNGDFYLCLDKNKQIKNLIAPVLATNNGWEAQDEQDELKTLDATLPKTKLPLKLAILRNLETRQNIRCFCSTRTDLNPEEMLQKYNRRRLVKKGFKDLISSYFLDEIATSDPQKAEFEYYCIMIARLAYEHFLKELGGEHYRREDDSKTTLQGMRNLLFEKRNFTLHQDSDDNLVVTLLDSDGDALEQRIATMLNDRMAQGKNKVLWWGNRGILLRTKDQYKNPFIRNNERPTL
jgi:hypothetical protein